LKLVGLGFGGRIILALSFAWGWNAEQLIDEGLEFIANPVTSGYVRPDVKAKHYSY